MEQEKLSKHYPHVRFYCNWVFHPEIDRQPLANSILDKITKEFNCTDIKEYNDTILQIIGLQYFRKELIELFNIFNFDNTILENYYTWLNLINVLTGLLIEKPLKRKTFDNLNNKIIAISLKLFPYIEEQESKIYWIVETNRIGSVKGEFNLPELKSDFQKSN